MGRYAFFNTGVEYKFAFACQDSGDILLFGGLGTFGSDISHQYFEDEEYEDPYHEWCQEDKELILSRLNQLAKKLSIERIDFTLYDKTVKGTADLKDKLYDMIQGKDEKLGYMFLLGCIIYHQLLYTDKLTVHYEN
jgi:hypothetical protein